MTLISADNNWVLLSIMFLSSFIAIWLEQRYKQAGQIHGAKELGTWLGIIVGSILGA